MASEIIVDGEVISLPTDLITNPDLLAEILTTSTWENQLDESHKNSLKKLLPSSLDDKETDKTLKMLLSGEDINSFHELLPEQSGNPVKQFLSQIKNGYHSPLAYQVRRSYQKTMKVKGKLLKHKYYHQLLKEVIVSRQCHLAVAAHPQSFKLSRGKIPSLPKGENPQIQEAADRLYYQLLDGAKTEAKAHQDFADINTNSWDSDSDQPTSSGGKPLSHNPNSVSFSQFKEMLLQHKRRRDAKINTPDLNVNGIKLADVIARTFVGARKAQGPLGKKRKHTEVIKNNKQKRVKGSFTSGRLKVINNTGKTDGKGPRYNIKHGKSQKQMTQPSCYLELIKDVIILSQDKTLSSVEQLIGGWLASADASKYMWTTTRKDWLKLLISALDYMKQPQLVNGKDVTLVTDSDGVLAWLGFVEEQDEASLLKQSCEQWLLQLPQMHSNDSMTSPDDEVTTFQLQEQRRYRYPHQAFVYTINGNRYAVPPVKGSTGPTKEGRVAREHYLLRPERPPQVTLLALTRDAVARLPGGTGARNDVCNLLRQSQYLAEVVTDQQINSAVSGALDRLHYESDPCVKFDASRRLWVYLHADRSIHELERLHVEQLGAPKKKRIKEKTKRTKTKGKVAEQENDGKQQTAGNNIPIMGPVDPSSLHVTQLNQSDSNKTAQSTKVHPTKKKTKNITSSVTSQSDAQNTSPSGTTTIQMTQKQLLAMTRNMSTASQGSREVVITQRDGGHSGALHKHVKGTLVSQQNGQPSLKLILKPAVDDQQKPTAELVRVLDAKSMAKQHVLTADTLRRLSEQLSAASSRPIKIVQQQTAGKSSNTGKQRVINISTKSETPTPSGVKLAVGQQHGGDMALDGTRIVLTASRSKTSATSGKAIPPQLVANSSRLVMTQGGANQPIQMMSGNPPKTLQIMSGGKVQTVQVLTPSGNPQQASPRSLVLPKASNVVVTSLPQPLGES